jgi:alkyl hydroperoxide reductase subunit AhpF
MTKILNPDIENQVRQVLKEMVEPVEILYFTSTAESCEYCGPTRDLLEEIVPLSKKLSLQVFDLDQSAELAGQYHVDKTPCIVITGKLGERLTDYGIRIAGIPAGHEFTSLIHSLVLVSKRDSALSHETRYFLKTLQKPLHLQVFVTPT